ncbi:MAG: polymorphic toxin-type HINT domain-containing protein [Nocardiopsaceae bacterium]|nr:polymorphic toxin-type HINT domain-containing protein [Nocardiopsaceae bacterium]
MADGTTTAIEDSTAGEKVWAFDPATGQEGPREVTDTITGAGEKTLVDITVTDPHGASDEHPFWAPEQAEWVDATDLQPGTWLRTSTGTWVQASAVEARTAPHQRVHNLTTHTGRPSEEIATIRSPSVDMPR